MSATTTKNLPQHFTPEIYVIPQFGSHIDLLLNTVIPQNHTIQQANSIIESNYIEINKTLSNISIETVRELTASLSYGSYEGKLQVVVIYALDKASIPAQNALLKLLEEPPQNTLIFLTVDTTDAVLSTILSRTNVLRLSKNDIQKHDFDISKYISIYNEISSYSYRQAIDLANEYSERPLALELVKSLSQIAHKELGTKPIVNKNCLYALVSAQQRLEQNVNTKLVLEQLFFTLKKLL